MVLNVISFYLPIHHGQRQFFLSTNVVKILKQKVRHDEAHKNGSFTTRLIPKNFKFLVFLFIYRNNENRNEPNILNGLLKKFVEFLS